MSSRSRAALVGVALGACALPSTASAAEQFHAATADDRLVTFHSDSPRSIRASVGLVGLNAGEDVVGLDVRPATDQLYALSNQGRLFVVNRTTGRLRAVGAAAIAPAITGGAFGFDFNPVVDRIRVVSDAEQNLRLVPDTGATAGVDGPLAYAAGDRSAGRDPSVTGSAYTNNVRGATATTLYGIDTASDSLVVQNPPNAGTLTSVGAGLGFDAREGVGFDIAASGAAYAVSRTTDDEASELRLVNLATGAATAVNEPRVGLSGQSIRALAATGDVDDDRTVPRISVASSSAQLASGLLARGLQFTVACDESCLVEGRVTVAGRRAGTVSGVVEGAGRVRLTIELSERARARLRRISTRLLLRIDVTDGAGNDVDATRTIRTR